MMVIIKLYGLKLYNFCRNEMLLLLLLVILLQVMYFFNTITLNTFKIDNVSVFIHEEYLNRDPKYHMLSKDPFNSFIKKFVRKEKYENCSKLPLLTSIVRDENLRSVLTLNINEDNHFENIYCCWSPIVSPIPKKPKPAKNFDSSITVKSCIDFEGPVVLPLDVDTLLVTCKNVTDKIKSRTVNIIYQNVHSVINVENVVDRFNISTEGIVTNQPKKLSVLLLGLDNVSRLSLYRNLPKTADYLDKKGWLLMKGYNKIDPYTFPNLMAILTGQGQNDSYEKCNPSIPFGLHHCPMLWQNFRNAGYATAYAEDEIYRSTFNWLKVGFVDPPTDYYLRPYMLAAEKLLKIRKRFKKTFCTSPELAAERIFNSVADFAIRFQEMPYFGIFWTNSLTHDSFNGLSSMDTRILSKLEHLEREDVMNDTMILFLSGHGTSVSNLTGLHEDKLPFFYIWLPQWFRDENPETFQALTINQNRLTSPFDVYETLRDIVIRAGGKAAPSTGCPKCQSLFKKVPEERGCEDAGIGSHWCACSSYETVNTSSKVIVQGVHKVLDNIENIVKKYKNKKGKRLCAKFKLKKIHRSHKVMDLTYESPLSTNYISWIEVTPGNARFEVTMRHHGSDKYSFKNEEIVRLDHYRSNSKCLNYGEKWLCYCL